MSRVRYIALGVCVGLAIAAAPARTHPQRPPVPPQVFKAVRAQWKNPADRARAFDVSWCESKFDVRSVSPTGDYGLFNLNRQAHDNWLDFGTRIFDPFYNAWAAHRMWMQRRWGPWYPSRSCWA